MLVRGDGRRPAKLRCGAGVIALEPEEESMSEISEGNGICTQITTVKLDPDHQDDILKLMVERARYRRASSQ